MTYEKPTVEVIVFDKHQEFLVYSQGGSYNESAARDAAIAAMGWGRWDTVIAQKDSSGNWIAYCTFVNGVVASAGQILCDKF